MTVEHSRPYPYHDFHHPIVTVLLLPCPWGFTLQPDSLYCDCDSQLISYKILCNINYQTIEQVPPVWIGHYSTQLKSSNSTLARGSTLATESECQGIVIHPNCPYDYCISTKTNISLNSTDKQCAFHRIGTLCGKCPEGFSLILGSSKCLPCSNLYLLLLIVFVLAGLLLVIFLITFNLTVSEGTINGIIFYGNVLHINRSIFFPSTEANPLAIFIAWLNLDLGIETCFYNGMDAYAKAWLQFIFPIYIWLIAGLIILLSHKFSIAARLCGRNAVKVLATLFLLSVAKLGRAVITALTYTALQYPDGLRVSVWLPDASVKFLQGKHIPLFITAVAFVALILCFVLVLMFIPCLQKKSHTPLLFWVNKLKPLFDAYAYTGSYRDRYRFWPGLLLFFLCILFFLFDLNRLNRPDTKLLLTVIGCFVAFARVWVFRGVYRKWPLDIIESSFILNLGLLTVATSYILEHGNSQKAQAVVVNVSVGIVFASFIAVLVYHAYKQLLTSVLLQRCVLAMTLRKSENRQPLEEPIRNQKDAPTTDLGSQQTNDVTEALLPPVTQFDKYREPVFEYEDQNT